MEGIMKGIMKGDKVESTHATVIGLAVDKKYGVLCNIPGSIAKVTNEEFARNFLNLQDDNGKTIIHHIIENPENGYRPGIWAMIELHLKGANLNIQDKLGNTALHTCANFYKGFMSNMRTTYSSLDFNKVFYLTFATSLKSGLIATESREDTRPPEERLMFACMADIGAMLLCGANSNTKNNKGETVFEIMTSTATMLGSDSLKPNICEASCKKAFWIFFNDEKHQFGYDKLAKVVYSYSPNVVNYATVPGNIEYPWAPNVVTWVKSIQIDTSVSLLATAYYSRERENVPTKVSNVSNISAKSMVMQSNTMVLPAGGGDRETCILQ
jgi:hypothetical protein